MTDRRTLPGRYYTDPVLFARERERVRVDVGLCGTVRRFRPRRVRRARGGRREPDRHPSQGRRAVGPLQRLCRHRGTRLCTEETGRFADRIQCPYHGWTYGLDGRLLGAPHMDGVPGFRREENGLTPVSCRLGRHLFVTLNPAPEPLDTQLNGPTERFAPWRMSELRRGHEWCMTSGRTGSS